MDTLITQYLALIGGWKVVTIAVLILLDTIMGIIVALKAGTFQWSYFANFLKSSVVVLFGGYFFLGVFVMANPSYQAIMPATMVIIDAKVLADLISKFQDLGISISITPASTTTSTTTTSTTTPAPTLAETSHATKPSQLLPPVK
jgi:fumarate reductase subunit C